MELQNINTLHDIKEHLKHIISYMKNTEELESACRFIVPCCFLEYLAKLYNGRNSGKDKDIYVKFLKEIFGLRNPRYATFTYNSPETKLYDQMYLILRCGLVHSFSLTPKNGSSAGKLRSIILADKNDNIEHLTNLRNNTIEDSCIFKLEDFIDDLDKSIDYLFEKAESDSVIAQNILDRVEDYPYIGALS